MIVMPQSWSSFCILHSEK